ncbi:tryptophan-rich sensory protein [Xinfangfangia sp. D13-10-4-6]|uniref:TspO/MBR family protein n=1 Tax=Pseudogemmobacter hezensis TaxID=2737662 RepID=UPI001553AA1B|nr:TspO/MBR family protein [Pseudogemmobacter hezensis]NPD17405.1 tryptophan-rich sensory protein [Pseudogemmobacter hezensis]
MRLIVFIVPVVVVGWIIGWLNVPGPWYQGLAKPAFNPPNWVFAPVWTALYVMIGAVGWRLWNRSADRGLRTLWVAQLALNYAWSPAFFGAEKPGLALTVISLLLAVILSFTLRARRHDPASATLFLPYLAWVAFAFVLNFEIWRLN